MNGTIVVLTDTHCHLNFESFLPDQELVIRRAREARVERILNPGVDLESSRSAVELARRHAEVFATVGVHPNDISDWNDSQMENLRGLAHHDKVVAIGEIGLDTYWDISPLDLQQRAFTEQLELAAVLGLPVVIHCRDKTPPGGPAMEAALSILTDWQKRLELNHPALAVTPGVLHSFSGDVDAAWRAVELHFMIGITGPVTFKKADVLRQIAGEIPLDSLLIETDAPFLTPHPFRGKRNEPAFVRYIGEKIAEIRKIEYEELVQKTGANATRLFHW